LKIDIRADIKSATKGLSRVQKKQIPFATALALNDAAFGARKELRKQAEKKFENPTPFTLNGFQVVKAKKKELTSIIYVESKRYKYMKFQIFGGTRMPERKAIVVPTSRMPLNKYGNMTKNKIKTILAKPNVVSTTINGRPGIFQTDRKVRTKRLVSYKDSVTYKPRFNFEKIVKGYVGNTFNRHMEKRLNAALATAR